MHGQMKGLCLAHMCQPQTCPVHPQNLKEAVFTSDILCCPVHPQGLLFASTRPALRPAPEFEGDLWGAPPQGITRGNYFCHSTLLCPPPQVPTWRI